jgi:hypothetical protein
VVQTCAEAVKCRCQLIRSIGKWSGTHFFSCSLFWCTTIASHTHSLLLLLLPSPGGNRLEQSIQEAYVSMIQRAKHFIYIENQYFISTVDNHVRLVLRFMVSSLSWCLSASLIRQTGSVQPNRCGAGGALGPSDTQQGAIHGDAHHSNHTLDGLRRGLEDAHHHQTVSLTSCPPFAFSFSRVSSPCPQQAIQDHPRGQTVHLRDSSQATWR